MTLRPARDDEQAYVLALIRRNMDSYYRRHGIVWQQALFDASWHETDNFILLGDGEPVGVLRRVVDASAVYIRDLQIDAAYQGQGVGTFALECCRHWARDAGLAEVRLRVFVDNPAQALYCREGFVEVRRDAVLVSMSCRVPAGADAQKRTESPSTV